MSTIDELLIPFEPISLAEMDDVRLLNRVDTKFMFPRSKLPAVIDRMKSDYTTLEAGGVRVSNYETIYFDTPDHRMYLKHHNGLMNRYKIRIRKYVNTNQSFFEIKLKNNKGRTIKKRILLPDLMGSIREIPEQFISASSPFTVDMLNPVLNVSYSRMTFVNKERTERVTLDIDLTFENIQGNESYKGLVIAELKQNCCTKSPFQSIMHQEHVFDSGISKYCLGIMSLHHTIKQNNFKEKLTLIKKLNHDNS
jgi:hypothetical protein